MVKGLGQVMSRVFLFFVVINLYLCISVQQLLGLFALKDCVRGERFG